MGEEAQAAAASVNFSQLARAGVIDIFRVRGEDTSIASGGGFISVVSFKLPDNSVGFLTAVGHEADHNGWNQISWRIATGPDNLRTAQVQRGFTSQVGLSWGRINNPGEVFVRIGNSKNITLQASHSFGSALLVDGLIIGYYWPVDKPGAPTL